MQQAARGCDSRREGCVVAHIALHAIAQVMESHQDGPAMVQWWNSKKLDGSASAAFFFLVWYTPDAKLGETASLTGEMPLWEMVAAL
jgi:hypothetical protein